MVDRSLIWLGQRLVVRYMRYKGTYPALDYLDDSSPEVRARFIALARRLADVAALPDKAHRHFLKAPFEDLFELKPLNARLFGFFYQSSFYVTSGADKKKAKAQVLDYQRAMELRLDFLAGVSRTRRHKR